MRVGEAKRRRFLLLAGATALVLAPRGVGVAVLEHAWPRAAPPRPGSIPISAAAPPPGPLLELAVPARAALRLALGAEVGAGWPPSRPSVPEAPRAASAPAELAPLAGAALAAEPVAEPPALLLLSIAAGSWLAARRSRQPPKRGGRFARNASMPSTASASSRLSAITAPASR